MIMFFVFIINLRWFIRVIVRIDLIIDFESLIFFIEKDK